jgi:hypothetical protein
MVFFQPFHESPSLGNLPLNFGAMEKLDLFAQTIFAKKKPTGVERVSHDHRTLERKRRSYENRYGSDNERISRCVLWRSQAGESTG